MDTFTQFKDILFRISGIDPSAVTEEIEYRVDLGLDSVDLTEILVEMERVFEVLIDEEEIEPVKTVGELLALVEDKREQKRPLAAATG